MSEHNNIDTSNHVENGSEISSVSQIVGPGSDHNSNDEQHEGNLTQSQHSNSSASSSSARCAICWDRLGEVGYVFPCGHKFDLACIQRWISNGGNERTSNTCPVCRNPIVELRHSLDDEGDFQSEIVEIDGSRRRRATSEERRAEETERVEWNRRIRELQRQQTEIIRRHIYGRVESGDEDITPEMSDRQIHAAFERRRLRDLPAYQLPPFGAVVLDLPYDDAHRLPGVGREAMLQVNRTGLVTRTVLQKRTAITSKFALEDVETDLPVSFEDEAANSHLQEYRKAVSEISDSLAGFSSGLTFQSAFRRITSPMVSDNRNIASSEHIVDFSSSPNISREEEYIFYEITWQKILREEGPAFEDGDFDEDPPSELISLGKPIIDKAARQLTEEIQGVLEEIERTFRRVDLDRGMTNLRELFTEFGPCMYCQAQHRNGDCLLLGLSWQIVV